MAPVFYYCYDAWCGWCFGFSPVLLQIANTYRDRYPMEVLSGGMILPEQPTHISAMASYIASAYKQVEAATGIRFGADFLWHIHHPDQSDWYPHSEMPAIALCIFKEAFPDLQAQFASDLQTVLHVEGRDLTDPEAYRHLLEKYGLAPAPFFDKLKSDEYKEKAYYEFALCKQLQVTGFPTLFLQTGEQKLYLLSRGFSPFETIQERILSVEREINSQG